MVIQHYKKKKKTKENKIRYKGNSKRMKKSKRAKKCNKNIKTLYKSREKIIKLFNDYFEILPEVKYKTKYREGLKI